MFGIDDLIGGAIGAATGIIGAKKGYDAQKKAINQAIGTQRESMEELEPWQQAGQEALQAWQQRVMEGPGDFAESDEYQFIRGEGEKAIQRAASTGAGFGTGAMGKSLARYGQGLASTFYDKFQNRYLKSLVPFQQLAAVGERAVGNRANIRNQIADLQFDKGVSKGNVWATGANAVRGGISDAVTLSQLGQGMGGGGVPITSAPQVPGNVQTLGGAFDQNRLSMAGRTPLGWNPSQVGRL